MTRAAPWTVVLFAFVASACTGSRGPYDASADADDSRGAADGATAMDSVDGAGCTPGLDQTCIGIPFSSSINGRCRADRTCACDPGFALDPATGLCR